MNKKAVNLILTLALCQQNAFSQAQQKTETKKQAAEKSHSFPRKISKKAQCTHEEKYETLGSILKDMITNNSAIKAAEAECLGQAKQAAVAFLGMLMPDNVSFGVSNTVKIEKDQTVFDAANKIIEDGKSNETNHTKTLELHKNLTSSTFTEVHTARYAYKAAISNYQIVINRELQELLPHLLNIIQAEKIIEYHKSNMTKLERGLNSTTARASKAVGLASEADLSNAKADYESGKAEFMAAQEQIHQAKEMFYIKVGRYPKDDLSKLTKQIDHLINKDEINKALQTYPSIKATFNQYISNRSKSIGSTADRLLPSIGFGIDRESAGNPFGGRTPTYKLRGSFKLDLYDVNKVKNNIHTSSQAASALAKYKGEKQKVQFEYDSYLSNKTSLKNQVASFKQAVVASERYAQAEASKFNISFQEDHRWIISPTNMLQAFKTAHQRKLQLLEANRKLMQNEINFRAISGELFTISLQAKKLISKASVKTNF